MTIYDKKQRKKSQFIRDNNITASSTLDYVKSGVNFSIPWEVILQVISDYLMIDDGIKFFDTIELMQAADLEMGDVVVVRDRNFTLFDITQNALDAQDVELDNGFTATYKTQLVKQHFTTDSALRDFQSVYVDDGHILTLNNSIGTVQTGSVTDDGQNYIVFNDDGNRYWSRSRTNKISLEWDNSRFYAIGDTVFKSGLAFKALTISQNVDPLTSNGIAWEIQRESLKTLTSFRGVQKMTEGESNGVTLNNLFSTLISKFGEGCKITTDFNSIQNDGGGAEYFLYSLSNYRALINNGSYVPDGSVTLFTGKNHYVGGTTYIAVLNDNANANILQYGARNAGSSYTFDSGQILFDARILTNRIAIPRTANGILVDRSSFTGIDQEYFGLGGSIRAPHLVSSSDRGVGTHTVGISGTVTLYNLNVRGSIDTGYISIGTNYPTAAGRGISILGTANKQWSSIRDVFISGYDQGILHDSAYYFEYQNCNLHNNNIGFELTDATDGAVGSSPFYGGHIRDNHVAGMKINGNNDFHVSDTVFEFNRTHIIHTSGGSRFSGCYLGDGPWQVANVTGGKLILDQQGVSSIGSGGNLAAGYSGTAGIDKKVTYHCGGVDAANSGTIVEFHNAKIERNVYSNYGVSSGTRDNGSDLRARFGAKFFFYNTKIESYFPISYSSDAGSMRNGDINNNYFVNGLFDRPETLLYDIAGSSSVSTNTDNPFALNTATLSASGNFGYACRFSVPENFVGRQMAVCFLVGTLTGVTSNRTVTTSGMTLTTPNFSEAGTSFWAAGGLESVGMSWYTANITATEGFFQINANSGVATTLKIYGFILTETENYQKMGNYIGAHVRRYASVAPSTGTWKVGDTFINNAPSAGNTKFVCTVAGTPGTWVSTG